MLRTTTVLLALAASPQLAALAQDCNANGVPDAQETVEYATYGFDGADAATSFLAGDAVQASGSVRLNSGANSVGDWIAARQFRVGEGLLRVELRFRATGTADGMRLRLVPLFTPGFPADICCSDLVDVHFDHYENSDQGEHEIDGNHFELRYRNQHVVSVTPSFSIDDGAWRTAVFELDGDRVSFRVLDESGLDETIFDAVELPDFAPFHGQVVANGWNGAGGGDTQHWIDDVRISGSPCLLAPDCDGDGVSDQTELALGTALDLDANGLPDGCATPPLTIDAPALSLSAGGTRTFFLAAGPQPTLNLYLLLGSASGTAPGLDLPVGTLPLVPDAWLEHGLCHLNLPPYERSLGVLAPDGTATATLTAPAGTDPSLVGLTLHHAFLVFDLTSAGGPTASFVSNAVGLELVP